MTPLHPLTHTNATPIGKTPYRVRAKHFRHAYDMLSLELMNGPQAMCVYEGACAAQDAFMANLLKCEAEVGHRVYDIAGAES